MRLVLLMLFAFSTPSFADDHETKCPKTHYDCGNGICCSK